MWLYFFTYKFKMSRPLYFLTDFKNEFNWIYVISRLYHGDPVLNPLTPWDRPPLKNIFCIYGVDSRTEVLIKMRHLSIDSLKQWIIWDIFLPNRLVTISHQVASLTLTTGLWLMLYMSLKDLCIPGLVWNYGDYDVINFVVEHRLLF